MNKFVIVVLIFICADCLAKDRLGLLYAEYDDCVGYFTRIIRKAEFNSNDAQCDNTWINYGAPDEAYGYRNSRKTRIISVVNTIDKDVMGNEWFYAVGTVVEGQCTGALIYIQNDVYMRNGTCDDGTGITDVMSDVNQAVIDIRGESCDTRCNGTVWFRYRPGKTY